MASMLRRKKKGKDEDVQGEGKKKKLTAAEKKKAEAELRANLPMRSAVGRRGVFEITGELSYTFAVGQIPGGQFYPVDIVIKGHLLYLFELGAMPSSKPRGFSLPPGRPSPGYNQCMLLKWRCPTSIVSAASSLTCPVGAGYS